MVFCSAKFEKRNNMKKCAEIRKKVCGKPVFKLYRHESLKYYDNAIPFRKLEILGVWGALINVTLGITLFQSE